MYLLIDAETGQALGDFVRDEPTPAAGQQVIIVPGSAQMGVSQWDPVLRGFVDVPSNSARTLTGQQILNLYTPEQHGRARRMIFATYPDGHPQAGELIDPHATVQRLIDLTTSQFEPISVSDPKYIAGAQALRAFGVIESDAELERILEGREPEGASFLGTYGPTSSPS